MKYSLLFLIFTSISSYAADFRIVDFNESCENIEEKEIALGSQLIEVSSNNNYRFHNIHLNSPTNVVYFCTNKGLFKKGWYWYRFDNFRDAVNFVERIKPILFTMYGEPKSGLKKYYSVMTPEEIKYENLRLEWKLARVLVKTSVTGGGKNGDKQTEFIISFEPSDE